MLKFLYRGCFGFAGRVIRFRILYIRNLQLLQLNMLRIRENYILSHCAVGECKKRNFSNNIPLSTEATYSMSEIIPEELPDIHDHAKMSHLVLSTDFPEEKNVFIRFVSP